uniref:HORMA domain-containing protein n=1 Tax=Globisporangium ultimum (strain ATCC 200006 / CBS 805.95 / DAOM BR144) TaxID=431595 RepID=K3WKQ3_GLOUD
MPLMLNILKTEAFEQRVLYGVPIHMNRYPALCEYIHSMLAGCRGWIYSGEMEKLCIVVLSEEGRKMDTLVIETKWNAALQAHSSVLSSPAAEDQSLPLVQLEDAFRAVMARLAATPVSLDVQSEGNGQKPNSFRILAHTAEDVAKPGTSIDETSVGNSWVLADPFWHEEEESKQKNEKELVPVKSIQADELPFQMQLYLEKR